MPNTPYLYNAKPMILAKAFKAPFKPLLYTIVICIFSGLLLLSGCVSNQQKTASNTQAEHQEPFNQPSQPNIQSADITPDNLQVAQTKIYHPIIWDEMRNNFDLADENYGHYERYLRFYNKRKIHLKKVSQRAKPYLHYILTEVKKRDMPYEIALLPVVESGFRPIARSHQRAVGLWQFIPSTAQIYDLHSDWWYDGRKDVVKSTTAALDYLQKLYRLNNNNWLLALASYNAGLGNVYRAQRKYRKKHKNQPNIKQYQPNFWEIQQFLPKETQGYVPKLLAVSHIVEYAKRFKVELEPIENQPYFSKIVLNKQISLGLVAKLSNTSKEVLSALNPGYHQPATPPVGSYQLLLPVDKASAFSSQLKTDKTIFQIHWKQHKIQPGDSLGLIAQKYQTSSQAIKKLNHMKSTLIRVGKTLLIPILSDQPGLVASNTKSVKNPPHIINSNPINTAKHVHIVQTGDSLWKLARYYNISTKKLTSWNKISAKSPLRQGQKLVIYSNQYGKKIIHTLKTGESLWTLSQRYKVSTRSIAGWNAISPKKILQPGMKITIWTKHNPSTKYVIKNGDNLWNIAKANNISAKTLALHNNLSMKSVLKPGQVIHIPSNAINT